jgi:hypothetical protein
LCLRGFCLRENTGTALYNNDITMVIIVIIDDHNHDNGNRNNDNNVHCKHNGHKKRILSDGFFLNG